MVLLKMLNTSFIQKFVSNNIPVFLGVVLSVLLFTGCAGKMGVSKVEMDKRFKDMNRTALTSNELSEQTQMFLRQHDLAGDWKACPDDVLEKADKLLEKKHDVSVLFVLSELCFFRAKTSPPLSDTAFNNYLSACYYAYSYLFDNKKGHMPSAYNPNFRLACNLYNRALAGCLVYFRDNKIKPETEFKTSMLHGKVVIRFSKEILEKLNKFQSFHITYEFEPCGFENHVKTYGVGVPVIAINNPEASKQETTAEKQPLKFQQTYSVTALLCFKDPASQKNEMVTDAQLHIFDPMKKHQATIAGKDVLLENDFTTPLAYTIETTPRPKGLLGLLRVESWNEIKGLYLLQSFDPDKIPVVMVHGLMSSPDTWLPMLNNLLADPVLREKYQFWFFMYPTGNPIIYSSSFLRDSLQAVQSRYNPEHNNRALNQMVLVGHSMGGLVSKLMIMGFDQPQWEKITGVSFDELNLKEKDRKTIQDTVFFKPQPYVSRVIFISTPHRGSEIADWSIGRLGARLVKLPVTLMKASFGIFTSLAQAGKQGIQFSTQSFPTGIDGLRPESMFVKITGQVPMPENVPYHSIIGDRKTANTTGGTDGVVPYQSSHLDGAASETIVHSGHNAHKHPLAIQEVKRILHQHLDKLNRPVNTRTQPAINQESKK